MFCDCCYSEDIGDRGQVCFRYEAQCAELEAALWWESLTDDERAQISTENFVLVLNRVFGGVYRPEVPF